MTKVLTIQAAATAGHSRLSERNRRRLQQLLFIAWAGGAAFLTYSLVYALRKPFTAATFAGFEVFGFDYKVVVTLAQIFGYMLAKFAGIKIISELRRERRMRFLVGSSVAAELSLAAFGLLPLPWNVAAMFANGLSLGCMWGVVFSFIEGRRTTDILASLLSVSMVISSGAAKSVGLYVMTDWGVSPFWMPAVVGAAVLPLLLALAVALNRLPAPSAEDIEARAERTPLDARQRRKIMADYLPILLLIFLSTLLLTVLRDIKEDFLVSILDMTGRSSWLFARVDSLVTVIVLALFGMLALVRDNLKVLVSLLCLAVMATVSMSFVSLNFSALHLPVASWLLTQSLGIYVAYLCFQSVFFDRFIACFRIRGNVGFFIVVVDFLGYLGTVVVLLLRETLSAGVDWQTFYNRFSGIVGLICAAAFCISIVLVVQRHKSGQQPSIIQQ